jgi:CRP-like cAMP-binding protein
VQEGSFVLTTQDAESGKRMKVGPGTLLGELALFTDTRRPATATALEPSTVLRIPRPLFTKMLEGFPDAAQKLRDVIAKRINDSARDIQGVRSAFDVRQES